MTTNSAERLIWSLTAAIIFTIMAITGIKRINEFKNRQKEPDLFWERYNYLHQIPNK